MVDYKNVFVHGNIYCNKYISFLAIRFKFETFF